jgi:hypothetical protein
LTAAAISPNSPSAGAAASPGPGSSANPPLFGAPPVPPGTSTTPAAPADPLADLQRLYQRAAQRYGGIDSYIARLRRREQVNGKDHPESLLLFKFRKQPYSVYFKWLSEPGRGREVVYVKGHYDGLIHTLLAAGDIPLMPAGKRSSLPPDNVFVRSASRHSITEAGIGHSIDAFGGLLSAIAHGSRRPDTLKYLGPVQRPEFDAPLEAVEQTIVPGEEPPLPRGGSRSWFFDPESGLPVLLITRDHTGHEAEYYCYDRIQYPVRLDDDDFNPDRLWGVK